MPTPFTHPLRTKTLHLAPALLLSLTLFAHSMTTANLFFLRHHTSSLRLLIADGLFTLEFHHNAGNPAETSFFHATLPIHPLHAATQLAATTLYESHFSLGPQTLDSQLLALRALLAPPTDATFQLPLWLLPALLTLQLLRPHPRPTSPPSKSSPPDTPRTPPSQLSHCIKCLYL